ncbi:MocR-like pyridoxine biosynthesis transcription factor PdxR [Hyalangium versicolor]|uniref:MocR-like pyridoxine biosynthesis transcription factor PdxR n=1 Tax=Hyalangium versicolor TaxID=2861190 RepID=UPI001CCAC094|nr:PLP-dependent aminotransferase family protein [Hyalangium versicolor]
MSRAPTGIHTIIAIERGSAKPLYRQLYEGYREAIIDRRLRAGQKLPSTRSLANELRISRIPVLNAFEQLLAEGYLESRVGAGTFVASSLPGEAPARERRTPASSTLAQPGRRVVSRRAAEPVQAEVEPWLEGWGAFRVSQPAVERFPIQVWARLVSRHCRRSPRSLLNYGDPMGYKPFRETLASYLRTVRGLRCEAEQIMVVSGSQQALELSARVLLDPGSPVWVEDPGYAGARQLLAQAGARLVPVPVDDEGLEVATGMARSPKARAVYVTPSHQYPLGVTMSASRRLQLLEWAQRSGAWIIEDDYDSEFRYESLPVPALQGLDRDARVIYIGSFSKVLFPALRVGYLVIPADLVPRFARARDAMDLFPPTLYPPVLADFIGEGHFARHLRRMRALYRERRSALVEALGKEFGPALRVIGAQAGMHLVATLPPGMGDRQLSVRAAQERLWVMPLSSCYLGEASRQGLVLGFGGTSASDMPDAVRRLRTVLGPMKRQG